MTYYIRLYVGSTTFHSKMDLPSCTTLSEATKFLSKEFFDSDRTYISLDNLDNYNHDPIVIRTSAINAFDVSEYAFPTSIIE